MVKQNITHLEKLSWLHGIYGLIFQHGARKVDPSDPSWISPADFVELGSSVLALGRWGDIQVNLC